MDKWLIQKKNRICYFSAFIIPVVMMIIISFWFGFYPFGKLSVLVADLRYQFVDYYGYLKNIFFGSDTYFYSFSKTFGGEMVGFSTYYLNNPFVLMLLFFPNDTLPAGVLFMIIIIIGLSGLSFNMLINRVYGTRWASLIFSTAYAFIGYYMAYFNCTIYFFNIMLLPIVALGLFDLVKTGKKKYLYIVTLFFSMVTNYYMGYMTCIFSLVFFLYLFLSNLSKENGFRNNRKTIWIYIGSSALAAGLAACNLVSVYYSLQGQKSSGFSLNMSRNFKMLDVFSGLYSTAFQGNISDGLPIIYCSVLAVVFLFLYFINRKISIKEKILSICILGFMLISFYIDALNMAWHGFNHPIGFPYRNSFFFSFLVLFIAYKGFIHMREEIKLYHGLIFIGIFTFYSGYLVLTNNEYVGRTQIIITGAVVCLTIACVFCFNYKKEYSIPIIIGLFMLQIGDLLCNGYFSINSYFPNRDTAFEEYSIEKYSEFVDETTEIINSIQNTDPGFYRIEKMYRRTHNDAMMIGYNGLSHFSSCETDQVKNFMGELGFRNNGNWAYYGEGSTTFSDCLMGVKYLLSQYDETAKPYSLISAYSDKYVYQNPYALALGFGTTDEIKNVQFHENEHFAYQNEIANSFANEKYEIYRPVQLENIELANVKKVDTVYQKIENEKEAYIEYQLRADSNDFIYMYLDAPTIQETTIYVNDLEKNDYFSRYGWSIREVGYFQPDEQIKVRIYLNQNQITIDNYEFYYENQKELDEWYQTAAKTKCSIIKNSSSHLTGTLNVAEETERIVFSIPYEKDWIVKIDGKKVETEKVLDSLLSITISPGEHSIELIYLPKGFIIGLVISIITGIIILAHIIYEKTSSKEKRIKVKISRKNIDN